jgi:YbbR domain-containing protein
MARSARLTRRAAEAVRANWTLKVLAAAAAVVLWLYVASGRESEIGFIVPIELRNIPPGTVVAGDVEREAQVRVAGPQARLAALSPHDVRVSVDVSPARPERPHAIRLTPASVAVPQGVHLVRVSPPEVMVRLEPVTRRRVPVAAVFGAPETGVELKGWRVEPAEVEVVGGAAQVARVTAVETVRIDLAGVARDIAREVPLAAPPGGVRIEGPATVRVQLRVGRAGS